MTVQGSFGSEKLGSRVDSDTYVRPWFSPAFFKNNRKVRGVQQHDTPTSVTPFVTIPGLLLMDGEGQPCCSNPVSNGNFLKKGEFQIFQCHPTRSRVQPNVVSLPQVGRDIIIWDHKTFLKNPALVKEDATIKSFRKWYSQFNSSKSPTWRDLRKKTLDW